MAIQRTLVIIKPDAARMGYERQILERYADADLHVVQKRTIHMSDEHACALYKEHERKHFFAGLVLSMVSGPCVVVLLDGENAIEKVREMNGAWKDASPGTIRHIFPSAGGPFNVVHASDSYNAVCREAILLGMEYDRR